MNSETIVERKRKLQRALDNLNAGKLGEAESYIQDILKNEIDSLTSEEIFKKASDLQKTIRKKRHLQKNRIIFLLVIIINASVLGILLLVPVNDVYIDAIFHADQVTVHNQEHITFGNISPASLDFSSFGLIKLDTESAQFSENEKNLKTLKKGQLDITSISPYSSLFIKTKSLLIDYLNFYPDSIIKIRKIVEQQSGLIFEIQKGRIDGEIFTDNFYELECFEVDVEKNSHFSGLLKINNKGPIVYDSLGEQAQLNIFFDQVKEPIKISRNFDVSSLDFVGEEDERIVSKLNSAIIRFPHYKRDAVELGQGDLIKLKPKNVFHVKEFSFGEDLFIRIEGNAEIINVNTKSLKPNILEWANEHKIFLLYIGALMSLISLIWVGMGRFELLHL